MISACSWIRGTPMNRYKVLSCGVAVVRKDRGRWLFLLLRAYRYWDFPKGIVEQGEEPVQAAIREVREETTITGLDFKWGYEYMDTGPYNKGKTARYYIARTSQEHVELPVNPEIGMPEHHEFRWVPYEEALALVGSRVKPVVRWAFEKISGTDPA